MESSKQQVSYLGKYHILQTLGSGNTAKVKLAIDSETQNKVAIKLMKKEANLNYVYQDVTIMQQLSHPNIVNLLEFNKGEYVNSIGRVKTVIYLVFELAEGGELFDQVLQSGFSREVSRTYFNQLLNALEYCISRNVSHRDLKPENLLFDSNYNLKVADFGYATFLSGKDGSGILRTYVGTPAYMAPEIHLRLPYSGEAVDLFASAIILFIIYSGQAPFYSAQSQDDNYKPFCINKLEKFWNTHSKYKNNPNFFEPEFKDLISRMLAYDPKNRMSLQQVKEHPWVRGQQSDLQSIQNEFKKKQEEKKKEAEVEKQLKRMQKQQSNMMYTGIQGFRSLGEENQNFEFNLPEFQEDLSMPRILQEKQDKIIKQNDFVTILDADYLLKLLLGICTEKVTIHGNLENKNFSKVQLNKNGKYKIQCESIDFEVPIKLDILIQKLNEDTNCVSYIRKSGSCLDFYEKVRVVNEQLQNLRKQ